MILRIANNHQSLKWSHLINAVYVKHCQNCAHVGSVLRLPIVRHWLSNQPRIRFILMLHRRIKGSSSVLVSITSESNRLCRNRGQKEIPLNKIISLRFSQSRRSSKIIRKSRRDITMRLLNHRHIMPLETQIVIYSRLWPHRWMCQDQIRRPQTMSTLSRTWRSLVITLVPTITLWGRQLTISGYKW